MDVECRHNDGWRDDDDYEDDDDDEEDDDEDSDHDDDDNDDEENYEDDDNGDVLTRAHSLKSSPWSHTRLIKCVPIEENKWLAGTK